jgi:hypothetical protein
MAKMRTGRTTPLTTDPTTGARIANPEKMGAKEFGREGKTVFDVPGYEKAEGREISSWPVVREAFKSGKYGSRKLGLNEKELKRDPRIMNYLSGKTDILSEDIDEPMIVRRTNNMTKEKEVLIDDRYTPGGPTYNKITKGSKIPKGQVVDMGTARWQEQSKVVGATGYDKSWSSSHGSEAYGEDWTPSTKKPVSTPKPTVEPTIKKVPVTAPKPVVSTTPTTAPTIKSKSTVVATPKEDMTLSKMPIKKPGLIKTEKQSLQGEYSPKEAPEYIQPGYRRENRKGGLSPTLAAKVVQKLTGYNKDYMEGKNGNFGEIDRSKGWDTSTSTKTGKPTETPRRTEFQGASSLKDIVAQKKYNKAYNAYASSADNPANRNTVTSQLLKLGEFLKR